MYFSLIQIDQVQKCLQFETKRDAIVKGKITAKSIKIANVPHKLTLQR